jgi:hypothetical protein
MKYNIEVEARWANKRKKKYHSTFSLIARTKQNFDVEKTDM